jgi:hypothetical protein
LTIFFGVIGTIGVAGWAYDEFFKRSGPNESHGTKDSVTAFVQHPAQPLETVKQPIEQPKQQLTERPAEPQTKSPRKATSKPPEPKQSGSDNAQTGPITAGPCSNVQVGGNNNDASTNCNFAPPSRRILPESRAEVVAILKSNPGKITINYVEGDEPHRFASDMYGILQDAGWTVGRFWPVLFDKPWTGVLVEVSANNKLYSDDGHQVHVPHDSLAGTLLQALVKAGVPRQSLSVRSTTEHPEDTIGLVVGPHPDN